MHKSASPATGIRNINPKRLSGKSVTSISPDPIKARTLSIGGGGGSGSGSASGSGMGAGSSSSGHAHAHTTNGTTASTAAASASTGNGGNTTPPYGAAVSGGGSVGAATGLAGSSSTPTAAGGKDSKQQQSSSFSFGMNSNASSGTAAAGTAAGGTVPIPGASGSAGSLTAGTNSPDPVGVALAAQYANFTHVASATATGGAASGTAASPSPSPGGSIRIWPELRGTRLRAFGINVPGHKMEDRVVLIVDLFGFLRAHTIVNGINSSSNPISPTAASSQAIPAGATTKWSNAINPMYVKDISPLDPTQLMSAKGIGLFGVCDGHCGEFAAEFVAQRLPFQLVAEPAFRKGDYETAMLKAFEKSHAALMACETYFPKQPLYDFSAGATVSMALVTPQYTIFAFLGDSPIAIWPRDTKTLSQYASSPIALTAAAAAATAAATTIVSAASAAAAGTRAKSNSVSGSGGGAGASNAGTAAASSTAVVGASTSPNGADALPLPDFLFQPHCSMCKFDYERVIKSNVFWDLHIRSAPTWDVYFADEHDWLRSKGESIQTRVGLSCLNVWGTLGDGVYDIQIFNGLVKAVQEYRVKQFTADADFILRKRMAAAAVDTMMKSKTASTSVTDAIMNDNSAWDALYEACTRWLKSQPKYAFLRHHIAFVESTARATPTFVRFIRKLLIRLANPNQPPILETKISPLRRIPELRKVLSSSIDRFVITTDGMFAGIHRPHHLEAARKALLKMLTAAPNSVLENLAKRKYSDDASMILVAFD